MTAAAVQVVRLAVAGREEHLRICGSGDGAAVLLVPPLFGELNRCRRLLADVMDALALLGRGSALPDLPGTGESLTPIEQVTLEDWRTAVADAAALLHGATGQRPIVAALRGGALLDDAADASARWRLMPVDGTTILRELARAQRLTTVSGVQAAGPAFAGTPLAAALAGPLNTAVPQATARIARLADDPKTADHRIPGSPLWRRAEPGRDLDMARAIAADIDRMAKTCAIS